MSQTLKLQGSLLVKNTILNFGAKVLPLVVMGATIPYVIEGLGTARYGVFTLIWAVLGYFSILDLGLGKATAKKVAEALGRGESAGQRRKRLNSPYRVDSCRSYTGVRVNWKFHPNYIHAASGR